MEKRRFWNESSAWSSVVARRGGLGGVPDGAAGGRIPDESANRM